jgi:hypothetical protein
VPQDRSSSFASTRPTLSSALAIIAASVGLVWPPMPGLPWNRAISSGFASCGLWTAKWCRHRKNGRSLFLSMNPSALSVSQSAR